MQLWQYCLLVTAKLLYMFRTLSASIIRSITTAEAATGACHGSGRYISSKDVRPRTCHCTSAVATDLGHPYWIYIFATHGMHQWLLLRLLVLLMMDAESVRNMYSNFAVTINNTAKVASSWFFI